MDELVKVYLGVQHCGDPNGGCDGCPYYPDPNCEDTLRANTLAMLSKLGGCGNCLNARYEGTNGEKWLHCLVMAPEKRNPFGNCPSWRAKLE